MVQRGNQLNQAKLGDLEIFPPSINLHSVTRCCFTWPAFQPPLAAVIVPVNCFSSLFDYKVSCEWLVDMFQSSFSLPETPSPTPPSLPNPKTLVTSHSRSPYTVSLPDLTSKVSHRKSVFIMVYSSPRHMYRTNYSFVSIIHLMPLYRIC